MTTARDRPAVDRAPTPVDRSVLTRLRGIPWWAAVLLGLLPTIGCVTADVLRTGTVGLAFFVGYPLGCVVAALAARRDSLFVPMVQPPLALAVSVPVAVAVAGTLPTSGGLATVLALAGPLVAGFPAMAITTTLCLAIGAARLVLQPLAAEGSGGRRPAAGRSSSRDSGRDSGRDEREARGEDRRRPERSERADRTERDDRERPDTRSGPPGPGRTPLRVTSRRGTPTDAAAPPAGDAAVPTEPAPRVGPGPAGPGPAGPAAAGPAAAGSAGAGPAPAGPGPGPAGPAPATPGAPPIPAAGTDEEPARRSPLVLPPEDDRDDDRGRGRPTPSRDAERRRRVREERMRADRMREERRREGQREAAQVEQRRESDRRAGTEHWGPRRRPEG